MVLDSYTSASIPHSIDTDRYRRIEHVLLIISMIASIAAAYMLFFAGSSLTANYQLSSSSLAVIDSIQSEVRRKPQSLPAWSDALEKDILYAKDQIFTGENATAKIVFRDLTEFDLGQNTLIVIEENNKEAILNLLRGTLHIKSSTAQNSNLKIKSGKTTARLSGENTRARMSAGKNGDVAIAVTEGNMRFGSDAQQVALSQGQSTKLSNEGELGTVETSPLMLVRPDYGTTLIIAPESAGVELFWKDDGDGPFLIELSKTPDFAGIAASRQSTTMSTTLPIPTEGYWYWRVINIKTAGKSLPQLLRIKFESAPIILEPRTDKPAAKDENGFITFDWMDQLDSVSYRFELSEDASFSKVIKTIDNTKPPLRISSGSSSRKMFWRVRASAQNRPEALWSNPAAFEILVPAAMPLAPEPDELDAPELEDTYQIKIPKSGAIRRHPTKSFWQYFNLVGTAYADTVAPIAEIQWRPVAGAHKYFVEVSSTEDFHVRIIEKEVKSPTLDVSALKPGEYYLRVTSVDIIGKRGKTSKPSRIIIKAPEVAPPVQATVTTQKQTQRQVAAAPMQQAPVAPKPKFNRMASIEVAVGPKYILYKTRTGIPDTDANIITANNFLLAGDIKFGKWSTHLTYERAATYIFNSPETGKLDIAQESLHLLFQNIGVLLAYQPATTRWKVGGGVMLETFPYLYTTDHQTIGRRHASAWSPALFAEYTHTLNDRTQLNARLLANAHLGGSDDRIRESAKLGFNLGYKRQLRFERASYGFNWQADGHRSQINEPTWRADTEIYTQSLYGNFSYGF